LASTHAIRNSFSVQFNIAALIKQNDSFYGRKTEFDTYNNMAINSLLHNGRIDLGLGAYFIRTFGFNSIKAGICASLPAGGDRYNWSAENAAFFGGDMLKKEHADAYKKGNIIIAVPIIFTLNF